MRVFQCGRHFLAEKDLRWLSASDISAMMM